MNVGWGTVAKRTGENEARLSEAIFVGRETESKALKRALLKVSYRLGGAAFEDEQFHNVMVFHGPSGTGQMALKRILS